MSNLKDENTDLLTQIANLTEELTQSKQSLLTNNTEQNIPLAEVEETSSNNSQAASNISDNKSNDSGLGLSDSLQNGPRLSDTEGNSVEDEKNEEVSPQVRTYFVKNGCRLIVFELPFIFFLAFSRSPQSMHQHPVWRLQIIMLAKGNETLYIFSLKHQRPLWWIALCTFRITGPKTITKACFQLHLYRTETYRISLLPELQSGTNDFERKESTTVRYDTIEVENSLNYFRRFTVLKVIVFPSL